MLPTAGPAVLTARGRQALVAEQCHHRHGAIFLLVRGKKKYQKAQLQLELREGAPVLYLQLMASLMSHMSHTSLM